jgi:hypothetical protein
MAENQRTFLTGFLHKGMCLGYHLAWAEWFDSLDLLLLLPLMLEPFFACMLYLKMIKSIWVLNSKMSIQWGFHEYPCFLSTASKFPRNFIPISSKFRCFDFGFISISISCFRRNFILILSKFRCRNRNFDFGFDFDLGIQSLISISASEFRF